MAFEFTPVKNVGVLSDWMEKSDRWLVGKLKGGNKVEANKATKVLMVRYTDMVHKSWAVLLRQMNNSDVAKGFASEYEASVYTAFSKTIEYVDLKEIRDDNWSFGPLLALFLCKEKRSIIRNISKLSALHSIEFDDSDEGKSPVNLHEDVASCLACEELDPVVEVIRRDKLEKLRDCITEEENNMTDGELAIWRSYENHIDDPQYGRNVSEDVGVSPSRVYTVVGNLKTRIAMRADSKYSLVR